MRREDRKTVVALRSRVEDVIFDHIDGLRLTPAGKNSYDNEIRVLDAWRYGLFVLYRQVRAMAPCFRIQPTCNARYGKHLHTPGTARFQPIWKFWNWVLRHAECLLPKGSLRRLLNIGTRRDSWRVHGQDRPNPCHHGSLRPGCGNATLGSVTFHQRQRGYMDLSGRLPKRTRVDIHANLVC